MRKHLTPVIVVVVILLSAGAWLFFGRSKAAATSYQTGTVTKGTLVVAVSATGTLDANNRITVSTSLSGTIDKIYVKNGDPVKAGQALIHVTLDQAGQLTLAKAQSSLLSAQNAVTQAQQGVTSAQQQKVSLHQGLLQAQSQLNQAQTDYTTAVNANTNSDLITQKQLALQSAQDALTVAKSKYGQADASIAQAKKAVTQAQADVTVNQQSVAQADGTVTASASGTVSDMVLVTGTVISSSSSSAAGTGNSGTKVATVVTSALPTATFALAEQDVARVTPGQKATITFDSLSGQTFTGTVIGVNQSGTVSSGVTTYPLVVQLDSQNSDILPNMTANVSVILKTKDNVLLVPSTAVKTNAAGGDYVQVLRNGQPQDITVTVGDASDSQTEIVSGLTDGQSIITATITASTNTSSSSSLFGGFRLGGGLNGGTRSSGTIRTTTGAAGGPGF